MQFILTINQTKALEWGLNAQQAMLFAVVHNAPTWAEEVVISGKVFYKLSKSKIISELPLLTDKPDTAYRLLKALELVEVIELSSNSVITLIRLTDKGKTWNTSEIYPSKVGKKSEVGSEKNPTDQVTSNQVTSNHKNTCDESFEMAWSAYPKRDGSNPKAAAQKCWNARLKEGVTVEEIMAGINRYKAYCMGKETIGTAFVMQAARFLGTNREYEAAWSAPAGLSYAPVGNGKRPRPTNLPEHKFPHPEWDNGVYEICTVGRHNPETGYLLPGQY